MNGLWVILAAACASVAAPQPEPPAPESRVSPDQFRAMVAGPNELMERGDLAGATAAFDRLLPQVAARHGPHSIEVADRLMAFGLILFMSDVDEAKRLSLDYFRRAIPAHRTAFGAGHPEVALAIGTYADAALQLSPDDPPADLDAALNEEYRIRVATRGSTDGVTMLTLLNIAEVRGTRSRTGGDAARISAATEVFRQAIAVLERKPYRDDEPSATAVFFGMARMYVRNGRMSDAMAAVLEARDHYRRHYAGRGEMCAVLDTQSRRFAEFLADRGHTDIAEQIDALFADDAACFENELEAAVRDSSR